ncbi:class I SAM-dependent methyltransferase [Pimelobacter simplex]|uniref:Class I SAM-dependent methyltransferase n=1 Tax=Nocardioides simplex TaxID=2045 RepID=A0A7J5E3Y7_NOCSI|nr:class I SAM-dependent methyltransferase [Pimelobacter simplex]KAB2812959.1 class I SAM-dependent methyltransferase [Pimelobacter simplex]
MYDGFAQYYDAVMGAPTARLERLAEFVADYGPTGGRALELGCGTGLLLEHLQPDFECSGLDSSPSMLEIAGRRCPAASLYLADMTNFRIGGAFDVIYSLFDTLNHVSPVERWSDVFRLAAEHLRVGGLLVFDVNTRTRLADLSRAEPWSLEVDGARVVLDVTQADSSTDIFEFHIDVSPPGEREPFSEVVPELAVGLEEIEARLHPWFSVLARVDEAGLPAGEISGHVYYACRRR